MTAVAAAFMTLRGLWYAKASTKDINAAFEVLHQAILKELKLFGVEVKGDIKLSQKP